MLVPVILNLFQDLRTQYGIVVCIATAFRRIEECPFPSSLRSEDPRAEPQKRHPYDLVIQSVERRIANKGIPAIFKEKVSEQITDLS